MSKGRSLTTYLNSASEADVVKLLSDLLDYYEAFYEAEIKGVDGFGSPSQEAIKYSGLYKKCKDILVRERNNRNTAFYSTEKLKTKFSSEYLNSQIDLLVKTQEDNPTEAIGKSKELIESCCKTILEEHRQPYDKNWSVSQLVKETMKTLQVSTDNISDETNEAKMIKAILGNLHGIAGNIADLRNAYGSGHGKSASYSGLSKRHARLAVGSSITLVEYLWDTYEWRKSKNRRIDQPK